MKTKIDGFHASVLRIAVFVMAVSVFVGQLTAQTTNTQGGATGTNDPMLVIRQDLDKLKQHVDDVEKYSEKALTGTTSQAHDSAYLGQIISGYFGAAVTAMAILFTTLLFVLGWNIWRQKGEWKSLEKKTNTILEQFEAKMTEVNQLIENKFTAEQAKLTALIKQEDESLKKLIEKNDLMIAAHTKALEEHAQKVDQHIAKIDELNQKQEAELKKYKPAGQLVEQFEADMAKVESRFLPPEQLKAYFIKLLLKNPSPWPVEFQQALTDELTKLLDESLDGNISKKPLTPTKTA